MISLLVAAVLFLIASVAVYIILRRQRHGGLAGGSGTASPPRTRALHGVARTYSLAEVEAHNTEHDLWLIIRGKVYDFTDYFSLHPGGEAILRNAGRDSTVGFSGSQHPPRVWDMVRHMFCFLSSVSVAPSLQLARRQPELCDTVYSFAFASACGSLANSFISFAVVIDTRAA